MLIVGTGALATLFAARLAKAGIEVTMLGSWREGLDALHKEGVRLIDAEGGEEKYPVQVAEDISGCMGAKYALVLVKAWQTEYVAQQLGECLRDDGLAVTLQNGLGNGEILASVLGEGRVAQGVTTTGASLIAPGVTRVGGEGLVSVETHPRLGALVEIFTEAGFQTEVVSSAQSLIWSKLVINAAINPLTALLNIPNGELLKRPSARALMGKLASETALVANAQNIPLSFDDPVAAAEDVAGRTAQNISSMLQDVRRGAPTEVEAICEAIAQTGKAHGVEAPLNDFFAELIKAHVESK
jgi:2-dehydropantoate 2-reductase